jgi:hypothetical protein
MRPRCNHRIHHDALIMAGGNEIVAWDTSKIKIIKKQ